MTLHQIGSSYPRTTETRCATTALTLRHLVVRRAHTVVPSQLGALDRKEMMDSLSRIQAWLALFAKDHLHTIWETLQKLPR